MKGQAYVIRVQASGSGEQAGCGRDSGPSPLALLTQVMDEAWEAGNLTPEESNEAFDATAGAILMAGDVRGRPCIVLDTNVLVQSIPSKGKFRPIIEFFDPGRFVLVVSNEILLEYEAVLLHLGDPRAWPLFCAFLEARPDEVLMAEPSYR